MAAAHREVAVACAIAVVVAMAEQPTKAVRVVVAERGMGGRRAAAVVESEPLMGRGVMRPIRR